jgi:release factor glutamine methyltransferase
MTIRDAKQVIIQTIEPLYENREANNIATLLLEDLTGLSKMNQFLQKQALFPDQLQDKLNTCMIRLSKGEPIQYIIGKAWFMEMELMVDSNTLIPRPETEELVDDLLKYLPLHYPNKVTILEVGAGSGCISIALAKYYPKASITSIDISGAALAVAKKNATAIGVQVNWEEMNFLNPIERKKLGTFDIIISNPPYIKMAEAAGMHKNVLEFEPHKALFVEDNDPLIFYKAIHDFSTTHLENGGSVFVEINEALGNETAAIFSNQYKVEIKKDMQGKDRMIKAYQF